MMHGRGIYGSGNFSSSSCFGNSMYNNHNGFNRQGLMNSGFTRYGFINNGWNMMIMVGFILIAAVLIYLLVQRSKNKKISSDSAIETLKMRYVQGEITKEEYLNVKEDIL